MLLFREGEGVTLWIVNNSALANPTRTKTTKKTPKTKQTSLFDTIFFNISKEKHIYKSFPMYRNHRTLVLLSLYNSGVECHFRKVEVEGSTPSRGLTFYINLSL